MNKEEFIQKLEQYKALKLHDVIDYDKFYLYSVITNSTAIEGSTITEVENQVLFDEGITVNSTLREAILEK
ncbi:hypothetical protein HMPREF2136_08910 [Prevotella bivia DNF00650]|nr:hypothetical protein [Prevotella bivia]KGF35611.1 hypothetical protein HMPREF2136_08910 [Prevotella bivia DNF00650]